MKQETTIYGLPPPKQWSSIFNNDSTITSAVLDRLLHHAETILIEGSSSRMKEQLEPTPAPAHTNPDPLA